MGLQSGEFGPKAVLKAAFPQSIHTLASLEAITKTVGGNTAAVVVVADGNVMFSGAPQSVNTMNEYLDYLTVQIAAMFKAANHVVIVFDEPMVLTAAKKEEQALRDKRHAPSEIPTSSDLPGLPLTDGFDSDGLPEGASVRAIYSSRGSRGRVTDIICSRLLKHFEKRFEGCLKGAPSKSVTFDGVDERGGSRSGKRTPAIHSTSNAVADVLFRDEAIGEGDQKLSIVADTIRASRFDKNSPFYKVSRAVLVTVDTDSIPIELLSHARRTELEHCGDDFRTFVGFKERSQQKRKNVGDSPLLGSHYTVVDIPVLYANLLLYLFSASRKEQLAFIDKRMRLRAVCLFALGCITCGTDFVLDADGRKGVSGFRFSEVLDQLRDICTSSPYPLAALDATFKADDTALLRVSAVVKDLISRIANHLDGAPRRKKNADLARATSNDIIKRICWNLAYFAGLERRDTRAWGF
jgi:hypothetical protein